VHTSIKTRYVDGKPKLISMPSESAFCVMSKQEMEAKSVQEIHKILKDRHICITDQSHLPLGFDEDGLATLSQLDKSVVIHGII
jgi:hypothetical protein